MPCGRLHVVDALFDFGEQGRSILDFVQGDRVRHKVEKELGIVLGGFAQRKIVERCDFSSKTLHQGRLPTLPHPFQDPNR